MAFAVRAFRARGGDRITLIARPPGSMPKKWPTGGIRRGVVRLDVRLRLIMRGQVAVGVPALTSGPLYRTSEVAIEHYSSTSCPRVDPGSSQPGCQQVQPVG